MDKEKLEKELEEIEEQIKKKEKTIYGSLKYQSLGNKTRNLWKKEEEKDRELRKLKQTIYGKYVNDYRPYRRLSITRIKSSVKEGIKRGLGVKYLYLVYESDIIKIVRWLIEKDLEKTNKKDILADISKIDKQLDRIKDEKRRLLDEVHTLKEKRKKTENKLNKEELDKERIKNKRREEIKKIIVKEFPNLMNKIRKEVGRGLLLDALED